MTFICPCPCHGENPGCEHCKEADHDLIEALSEAERLIRVFYAGEADALTLADAKAWLMEGAR